MPNKAKRKKVHQCQGCHLVFTLSAWKTCPQCGSPLKVIVANVITPPGAR